MAREYLGVVVCALALWLAACSDDNTAGVTEDGNPTAYGISSSSVVEISSGAVKDISSSDGTINNSSSSHVNSRSSSSSAEAVTPKFDLWNGKFDEKVNTNNDNTGWWYSFGDDYSYVSWPVSPGNSYSEDGLKGVFEHCGGICGKAVFQHPTSKPWVGIGFMLAEEDSTADVSSWGGVCVTYASEYPVDVYLAVEVGGVDTIKDASPMMAYPGITLPKTVTDEPSLVNLINPDVVITRCGKWSDFITSSWAEYNKDKLNKVYSGEEAAKEMKSLIFVLAGNSNDTVNFNIVGISTYDENLPQWKRDGGVNGRDVGLTTTNDDSLTCLWKGTLGETHVKTGYNDLDEYVGMLYGFDASPEGASVSVKSHAYPSLDINPYMYSGIVAECSGFCGTMEFTLEGAEYAAGGIGFHVTDDDGENPNFGDIRNWGGVCITYFSEKDAYLNFLVKDVPDDSTPKVTLPKTNALIERCFTWDDIAPGNPNMGAAVSTVQFVIKSNVDGEKVKFNVVGIGKYSATGACSIDKTVVSKSSSTM